MTSRTSGTNKTGSKGRFDIALKLHQSGQLDEAQQNYLNHLQDHPTDHETYHLMGILKAQQGELAESVNYLKHAIGIDATVATYHNNLGNALKGLKQYSDARVHYQRAIVINPSYAESINNLAGLYHLEGHEEEALQHYVKAITLQPDYIQAHFNLGLLFLKQKKFDEALTQFNNVLALHPENTAALLHIAQAYLRQDRYAEAIAPLRQLLEYHGEDVEALTSLGVTLAKQGKDQEAVSCFTNALAIDEQQLDARNNLAALFLKHDQHENAVRHYKQLLEVKPNDVEAKFNLAVALMSLGRLDDAIELFQEVINAYPGHADSFCNLGAIYLKQNKRQLALEAYQKAKQLAPQDKRISYTLSALTGEAAPSKAPNEYLTQLFDNYAFMFEKHLVNELQYQAPQLIYQAVKDKLQPKSIIYDLGCGTGLCGPLFKPFAERLVGIDLSEKMIEQANKKAIYDDLITADLVSGLMQDSEVIDLIIAADVFCYIGELKEVLQACYDRLDPEGLLVFTTEISVDRDYVLQPTARYAHHGDYLRDLLVKVGFTVNQLTTANTRLHEGKPLEGYLAVVSQ